MSVQAASRYFTVDEYHRMGEAGIFSEDDRVERLPAYARSGVPEVWIVDLAAGSSRAIVTPSAALTKTREPIAAASR